MTTGWVAGVAAGGMAGAGSACINPGRKKLAGEMLLVAEMPPHPVPSAVPTARSASDNTLIQLRFTECEI